MATAMQSALTLHPSPVASLGGPSKSPLSLRATTDLTLKLKSLVPVSRSRVRCAVGDVSAEGTNYLIGGAIAIALIGSSFPLFFSRKDTCPECDGAGFVRAGGGALRANAARKDSQQIVCKRCNGLGKLDQIDKA